MKNIFAKFQEYVKKPNRNTFDLSFFNNLTLKFGELTPVFCKEVIPGDSFRINTAFGLQLMPMKFPVQTPMRAYVHYFYVRNRTLWKDWMDFIGGTKDNLVQPYVTPIDKKKFFRVGGLADYLGVPNIMYGQFGNVQSNVIECEYKSDIYTFSNGGVTLISGYYSQFIDPEFATFSSQSFQGTGNNDVQHFPAASDINIVGKTRNEILTDYDTSFEDGLKIGTWYAGDAKCFSPLSLVGSFDIGQLNLRTCNIGINIPSQIKANNLYENTYKRMPFYVAIYDANGLVSTVAKKTADWTFTYSSDSNNTGVAQAVLNIDDLLTSNLGGVSAIDVFAYPLVTYSAHTSTEQEPYSSVGGYAFPINVTLVGHDDIEFQPYGYYCFLDLTASKSGSTAVIGDGNFVSTPYDSDIHLNALPFRAYEAIYNAYYRNPQNNPFILNGTPEYNRYNTTYDGGADSTDYDLYFRNWEYDFLTSAVQSPQQGTAPLVGISVTGEATFQDEDGNTYYAQAILNDQGEITGWQSHSSNMPTGSLRLLMDMAGSGISINDLRNVNAFQRFLENNIRRGLKYRDQLMSHFGVKARYDELDMPEFIGGCSTSINVNKLSQTSESGDTPLGSFVGQASAFGQSKHSITHYCDEHGFIIGIMSVVPVPVYSQLLPKFFVKSHQLDYYFPEFGHIGYQPIQQKEVSPLQTFYAGEDLNSVFGYNRAWYDYLASTDEVHAQFRTTMRDFLMNRTFDSAPELSEEFLLVDPDQLNDVFLAGTDDNDLYAPESDKIIGSIYFDVSAKRPIPLFGIPKLT